MNADDKHLPRVCSFSYWHCTLQEWWFAAVTDKCICEEKQALSDILIRQHTSWCCTIWANEVCMTMTTGRSAYSGKMKRRLKKSCILWKCKCNQWFCCTVCCRFMECRLYIGDCIHQIQWLHWNDASKLNTTRQWTIQLETDGKIQALSLSNCQYFFSLHAYLPQSKKKQIYTICTIYTTAGLQFMQSS